MTDDWMSLSGKQRKQFTLALVLRYGWVCCICGLPIKPKDLSCQHMTPRSKGGRTTYENCRPAHLRCNKQLQAKLTDGPAGLVHSGLAAFHIEPTRAPAKDAQPTGKPRRVVLVFGPPGAGKTTLARDLAEREGLTIYDADDAQWGRRHGKRFNAAMRAVGTDQHARAVVITAGATKSARAKAEATTKATETRLLIEDRGILIARVRARRRNTTPIAQQIRAVESWFNAYDSDR